MLIVFLVVGCLRRVGRRYMLGLGLRGRIGLFV